MKDYLKDVIQYIHGLGCIDLVRVDGTDKKTALSAVASDKSVVVTSEFKVPDPTFKGTFGMPNLNKLKLILDLEDYDDQSTIGFNTVQKDNETIKTAIHFQTKNGDFVNDYRLMSKELVSEQIRDLTFVGAVWNISFQPSVANILRLKKQAQVHAEEIHFSMRVENGDLKIYFGDPATHTGNFVFEPKVKGTITQQSWKWPVKVFSAIMDLPGDKTIRISDRVIEVTVDSNLAMHCYRIPAQSK